MANYDVVVIGGGPGGYVAAVRAAQEGLRVALIEQSYVGGLCLNLGCIPSKILLKDAAVLWRAKKMLASGRLTGELHAELDKWIAHWREKVEGIRSGLEQLIAGYNITILHGSARFISPTEIAISFADGGDETISTQNTIIACGAKAKTLPSLPIDGERVITSNEALFLKKIPKTLAIVGGGVIGCEMATLYSALGTNVTIVEYQNQLLPGFDTELSKTLQRAFRERGIKVILSAGVSDAKVSESDVTLSLSSGGPVDAERVLVAVGITGNFATLGLDAVGVTTERGFIPIDPATYRTNIPNIYAIGDVIMLPDRPHPGLAHVASCEGELAAEVIAHGEASWQIDYDNIPFAIFTDPEIGFCGSAVADPEKHIVQIVRDGWMGIGMALDEPPGLTKLIVDKEYGEIVGAHIIGVGATERIHAYTIARRAQETVRTMMHQMMAHPTYSETMREALLALDGHAVHVPRMHQKKE